MQRIDRRAEAVVINTNEVKNKKMISQYRRQCADMTWTVEVPRNKFEESCLLISSNVERGN